MLVNLEGADYKSGPYSVTFTAGQTIAVLNISITSDSILENDENFILTINSSSLPNGVSIELGQTTVTILDKDGECLASNVACSLVMLCNLIN